MSDKILLALAAGVAVGFFAAQAMAKASPQTPPPPATFSQWVQGLFD